VRVLRYLRKKTQALVYGSPFYRALLGRGKNPPHLHLILNDSWPGDAKAGQAIAASPSSPFEPAQPLTPAKRKPLLAHGWLRDLKAMGTDSAKRKARALLKDWLINRDNWEEESWAPDVLGERLTNWISFHDFCAVHADEDLEERLIASLLRQRNHLLRVLPAPLTGTEGLQAIKGLIVADLSLSKGRKALGLGLELLQRHLAAEILPDGGHISRNPDAQLKMLHHLIDIRAALRAAGQETPPELLTAIERMVPALKLFRHGDGGLAHFNGGHQDNGLEMEAVLSMAEARGRVLRRLPQTGYERVTAGRALLLVDVGVPPPWPHDKTAHAGLLSFEFSVGRERLIVNCGAGPEGDEEWRAATAATAAHSALILADTNACEVLPEGHIGHRPKPVAAQRYEQDGAHYVETAHGGYESGFHVTHHRSLCLAAEGEELHGRDLLSGPPGQEYTIRWHLHPTVQASLVQGGQAALLLTPSGLGWRFRIESGIMGGELSLESSVYCGGGTPRRTLQLKVTGRTDEDPAVIGWMLVREKKG